HNAYFTNFHVGHHPVAAPGVLEAFGQTIAKMRQVLDKIPQEKKATIQNASFRNYELWEGGLARPILNGTKRTTSALFKRCAEFLETNNEALEPAQGAVNHFDLIEGNVLYNSSRNGIDTHILDCDTLHRGWSP